MPKSQDQIRRDLGFWPVLVNYAGISGMRAPVPAWFLRFPKQVQKLSRAFFTFCELTLIFMAVSTIKGIVDEDEPSRRIECVGSLILLISAFLKYTFLDKQHHHFEKFITDLHTVSNQLLLNPVGDRTYLEFHRKKTRNIHIYTKLRYYSLVILCCTLMSAVLIQGLAWPTADRRLPMSGWFPIDRTDHWQFLVCILVTRFSSFSVFFFQFACFAQFEYFMLISLRDIYCDAAVHFPLAAINIQIIYLQKLLEKIVHTEDNGKLIKWWIVQHQDVLRNLNQFMMVAGPQLTILNSVSALQLFLYLFRVTEEDEIMITKHVAVATVCSFMLFHVYVVSYIGDEIAENSTKFSTTFDSPQFWDYPRKEKILLHHVAIRCTKPAILRYSKIGQLRVHNFGIIVYKMIGFFNTIYQIRNE